MDDASLDEFVDPDERAEIEEENTTTEHGQTPTVAEVEPATATSTWGLPSGTCDQCETGGVRLWNDEEAFVCRDCKEW